MSEVVLLYFDGCPSWQVALDRLREALTAVGADPDAVRLEQVTTPERADELAFRGSPTVLVDGVDPFADPTDPVGLSCRVYRGADGPSGAPTVAELVAVLR